MKKTLIKIAIFITSFVVSALVIGKIMNQGNNNMTMSMASATFPIVRMDKSGVAYNELHGYNGAREVKLQRDTITELGPERELSFQVDTYGLMVKEVYIEVRNRDGSRLIEKTLVRELREEGDRLYANTSLKDLIEKNQEYSLAVILVDENGRQIYYYTRVIWSQDTYAREKVQFVKDFHEKTFDKVAAKELVRYLESSSKGDNTTFHKVNIHSSFNQITWGNLGVTPLGEPVIDLKELATQTATLTLRRYVSTGEDKAQEYYLVEEEYRIRYTKDRTYLLAFDRTMTQIPRVEEDIYGNNKIALGIAPSDVPFVESMDGNIVVFEVAGRLCSYNITTNKVVILFSFMDPENKDARALYNQHRIKVLDVDEGGNVSFAVYGYMNRGRHEGDVGIALNYYDSALNTVEELLYIPYDKTAETLFCELDQLLYLNREHKLYLNMAHTIFEVNVEQKTYQPLIPEEATDSALISDTHKIVVWNDAERMEIINLGSNEQGSILVEEGETIRPLGFMGEDIIYGVARLEDIREQNTGEDFVPMYKICICSSTGEILKVYQQENIYTISCEVMKNQITLNRVEKTDKGIYKTITQEHIMNNLKQDEGKNKITVVAVDVFQKIVQLQVKKNIDEKTIQILTPKEVVFEGGREIDVYTKPGEEYYVYNSDGIHMITKSAAEAISYADETSGVVVDEVGNTVWYRGNRSTKNQIMAITAQSVTEGKTGLSVCLDTMLYVEGITRNTQTLLDDNRTVEEILEQSILGSKVIDMEGCTLDSTLYYVNQDIPVLALLNNGDAVLIVGFNQYNVVLMQPSNGSLYKKGMNEATTYFNNNGNRFLTYLKNDN